MSKSKRLKLSNQNIQSGIKNNIQCCPNDTFYSNNTVNINMLPQFTKIKNINNSYLGFYVQIMIHVSKSYKELCRINRCMKL